MQLSKKTIQRSLIGILILLILLLATAWLTIHQLQRYWGPKATVTPASGPLSCPLTGPLTQTVTNAACGSASTRGFATDLPDIGAMAAPHTVYFDATLLKATGVLTTPRSDSAHLDVYIAAKVTARTTTSALLAPIGSSQTVKLTWTSSAQTAAQYAAAKTDLTQIIIMIPTEFSTYLLNTVSPLTVADRKTYQDYENALTGTYDNASQAPTQAPILPFMLTNLAELDGQTAARLTLKMATHKRMRTIITQTDAFQVGDNVDMVVSDFNADQGTLASIQLTRLISQP